MQKQVGRTAISKRNFTVSIVSRIIGMLTSFIGRSIFVKTLSSEYLGLSGFFGNIFAVISLCELGFGTAISQSLYKPLHDGDEYKQAAIVAYFTKVYRVVGVVTLVLSLSCVWVLDSAVKSNIDKNIIIGAYLLFCMHGFFSFLLAPKINFVSCDGRMYLLSMTRSIVGVIGLAVQSMVLVMTENYLLYLSARILLVFMGDVLINIYADRKYPYLSIKTPVSLEYKKNLYVSVKALVLHKVGGVLNRSTDSLLLSYFVGLSGLGKYSNYALVIGTVGAFFDVAMNAVSSSVGDLGAENRGLRAKQILDRLCFINFYILTVGTSLFVSTLNPFIELWLGKDMLFSNFEMIIIVAAFYFSCIRDPIQIFVHSFGLFKQSRYLPIMRAVANLVFSAFFVEKMGVAGVFLGTILSTVLVPLFGEIVVLCRHGLHTKSTPLVLEMCRFVVSSFVICSLCYVLTCFVNPGFFGLWIRVLISLAVSNVMLVVMYHGDEKATYAKRIVFSKLSKKH